MTLGQSGSSWGLHSAVVLLGMWTSLIIEWTSPANFWKGENYLFFILMNISELLDWTRRQVGKIKLVFSLLFFLPSPIFAPPSANSMPQHLYTQSPASGRWHFAAATALPTAQLCIPSFMRRDVGCAFVSRHKHIEGLHVYLTLTIHLPLTQVSREWSNLIPSMTSTARQCWSTSDRLFAEPHTVFRAPGRAMEQWPPVCRVMGCAACATLGPLHPGPWTRCIPVCVTVGHRSCWPGRISYEWVPEQYPLGSRLNASLTAHEKAACCLLPLSTVLLTCNLVMLTKPRFQHGCLWTHMFYLRFLGYYWCHQLCWL